MRQKKIIILKPNEIEVTKTFSYRIFGSSSIHFLNQRKRNVNFIWNYLNNAAYEQLRKYNVWMSLSDFRAATVGLSSVKGQEALDFFGFEFHLHSQTIQAIIDKYYDARKKNKSRKAKAQLNFRRKDDRGWIPFRARKEDFSFKNEKNNTKHFIRYLGHKIQFKKHREIPNNHKLCQTEFTQDNKGNWYVNFTVSYVDIKKEKLHKSIGIDLNLSEDKQIVLSNDTVYGRKNLTKVKEEKTAIIHERIYKIKYNEDQRELLQEKKELTNIVYSDSSTATDDEKKSANEKVKILRDQLSAIWKARLANSTIKEKQILYKKLNKLYKILGKIEYKYANKRKDFQHKVSRKIADTYDEIYIGRGMNSKLTQTRMAKSFLDVAPSEFRHLVNYKARNNGYFADVNVNEDGTTFTCRECLLPTGPRGLVGLKERSWTCTNCNTFHKRDINSAELIEDVGQGKIEYCRKTKTMIIMSAGSSTEELLI